MFDDEFRPPRNRPAVDLLDELESIKGALTDRDNNNSPLRVPLLDDMVIHNLDNNASLLNIGQIFDDHQDEENEPTRNERTHDRSANKSTDDQPPVQFPRFTLDVAISDDLEMTEAPPFAAEPTAVSPPSAQRQRIRPDYSREVLIQELIDEFIPQIEAELHARLRQLDDAALRRLKDSK